MLTCQKSFPVVMAALICSGPALDASAANRSWIGGNAVWNTSTLNWNPADEPDDDDTAIFNTPNSVDLAIRSQTIFGLTMSGGISLSTNGNDLTVNGLVELSNSSTDLFVDAGSLFSADAVTINSAAEITLTGGQLTVLEESGSGVLDVNNGGELSGNGTIQFGDAVSAGTQLFNLDGTLTAHSTDADDLLSFAFATLTINIADIDGVIDLDGNDGVSAINVLRNDTLAINGGVLDGAYSGTINLSAGATFSRNVPWSLNGTLNANTGGSTAATIAGAAFTQTGGSINVDAGESLRFSSVLVANNGVIANNGLIVFDNAATIQNASQFQTGTQGSIEVNNGEVVVFDQGWDWDGDGGLDNRITINDSGSLSAFYQTDDTWDGAMYINGGNLLVAVNDNEWGQSGGLISIGGTTTSDISASGVFAKTGGAFNVDPTATLIINCPSVWSGGTLNVDGELFLANLVTWSGGIAVSGNGLIRTTNDSTVAASTTINVHTFDWDDSFAQDTVHSINSGATFTLNIIDFDADDDDMDDPINLGGNGAGLVINGPPQWIMDGTFTANTTGAGTATIGGTSRMVLTGTLFVNGNTTVSAPITFDAGSTTVTDISAELRLTGGNLTTDPNRLQGGLITGQWGYLIAIGGTALHGFGTISTPIDFDETSNLKADNGVLTLTGPIIGVNVLGTADSDGILNVAYPWNSGGNIRAVELQGGEIHGGTITNDNANGIVGHGTIRTRVINNTRIDAQSNAPLGGTDLWLTTVGNDNDWDGTTNTGSLNAQTAYLVLSDNAPFAFSGTVSAGAGNHVYVHGFELDFQPASAIHLTGGRYKSTETTHVGGTVVVNAGPDSEFDIEAGQTLDLGATSSTMLNGNLRLNTDNAVIRAGATFSGAGALRVIDGGALFLDAAADVNALIDNAGDFGVAGTGVGRADVRDFQQSATGELLVGLAGMGLNQFDRLVVSGAAQLGGELDVTLLGGFVPAQSDTFAVLSAPSVAGALADVPAGSRVNVSGGGIGSLRVNYGPGSPFGGNQVVLSDFQEVVFGTGDYDGNFVFDCADVDSLVGVIAGGSNNQAYDLTADGLVNSADLSRWLAVAGANNLPSGNPYLPGDGNLDGVVDGSDFLIWNSHKFTASSEWCAGDFNADGSVDGSDFVVWNANKFTSAAGVSAVPEPGIGMLCLMVLLLSVVTKVGR